MYNSDYYNNIVLDLSVGKGKKNLKSLLICGLSSTFKIYLCTLAQKLHYFRNPKNRAVDKSQTKSEKLQMEDILIPHAVLTAFIVALDEATTKILEETEKKQDEVLKLKEVDEEQLRTVVQL